MKCPHCAKEIHFTVTSSTVHEYDIFEKPEGSGVNAYDVAHGFCPACEKLIVMMREGMIHTKEYDEECLVNVQKTDILYPKFAVRPIDPEVPDNYRKDFQEAFGVISISPKASAAISRRLLQQLLREEAKVKPANLNKEIDEFISRKDVPTYLSNAVDAVRNVGNFATHPLKDTNTGEVVDVENGEAEWLLDVLELLFDFTFVQPKRLKERKKLLNEKLANLGKPPMKGT